MTAQTILPANTLSSGYDVANSLRFNSGSTDFLTTTQTAVTAERKKFTISCWVKRSVITSGNQTICSAGNGGGSEEFSLFFKSDDALEVYHHNGSSYEMRLITNKLFRDVSAWYHIVFVCDTANGTSALRQRLFVNGTELTNANSDFSTYDESPQNDNLPVNVDERFQIGSASWGNPGGGLGTGYNLFNGYIAEFYQTAGQANVATVFGEYDEDSPTIWKPINPSGLTFGTNGIRLEFKGTGTSANSSGLGADTSGNDNHLTVTNLTAVDQSTDTCTNNFATLNPLFGGNAQYATFTEGNLKVTGNNNSNAGCNLNSTLAPSSGKWYMEFKAIDIQGASYPGVGVIMEDDVFVSLGQVGGNPNSVSYRAGGTILSDGGVTATENAYTDNAIVSVALDLDNGAVYFANDNDYQANGDPTSGSSRTGSLYNFTASEKSYFFAITAYQATSIVSANFGSPDYAISSGNADANGHGNFEYAVPSGYFALCTKNLAEFG